MDELVNHLIDWGSYWWGSSSIEDRMISQVTKPLRTFWWGLLSRHTKKNTKVLLHLPRAEPISQEKDRCCHAVTSWRHTLCQIWTPYVKRFSRESANRRTDGKTGPILLARPLTREVIKIEGSWPLYRNHSTDHWKCRQLKDRENPTPSWSKEEVHLFQNCIHVIFSQGYFQ